MTESARPRADAPGEPAGGGDGSLPRTEAPLRDPYAAGAAPGSPGVGRSQSSSLWPPVAIASLVGLCVLGAMHFLAPPPKPPDSVVTVRPTNALLTAVRDLARLETTELHVEKVIDLSDRQSRLFG